MCLAFASHLTCMTTCPGTMPTAVVSREEQQAYETGRRNKARGRGGVTRPHTAPAPHARRRCLGRLKHVLAAVVWLSIGASLPGVLELQAARGAPLLDLQPLRRAHGPPLPLGEQLRRPVRAIAAAARRRPPPLCSAERSPPRARPQV